MRVRADEQIAFLGLVNTPGEDPNQTTIFDHITED